MTRKFKTVSLWVNDPKNNRFPNLYPMVMIDHQYHYRVTKSSLKRLSKLVNRCNKGHIHLDSLGWTIDIERAER